jgi:CRP/FNR family transcriptional regulator, cyclic AMP receptor protein
MKTMAELIRKHPFVAGMTEAQCATVAGCAKNAVFEPGSYIFREGQPADQFHLIRDGRVALEVYAPRRGSHVLQTLAPNDILGASWIVPPYRWTADARALDRVRTFAFDAACLRGKCDADPALGYALMKCFVPLLVQRMAAARMQAMDVYRAAP